MTSGLRVVALLLASALAAPAAADTPDAGTADAGASTSVPAAPLPDAHVPRLAVHAAPTSGVVTGDVVRLAIRADALEGDDVTVADRSFAPFEALASRARVEPARGGRHTFVFEIELLALEPGAQTIPAVELRVVTAAGLVGSVETEPIPLAVGSLLANEPNAALREPTKPVEVLQDDYTLLWILGGLLAAALVALVTWLVSRWWQARQRKPLPPPPPRPPWEIAVEKLAELRRRERAMLEAGEGVQFVDAVSDVVREYLGAVFGFDGLESTTDEMNALLASRDAPLGLRQEVGVYLDRCDLVKFAKVVPDLDEADLVLAKAQDIVQHGVPEPRPVPPAGGAGSNDASPPTPTLSGGAA